MEPHPKDTMATVLGHSEIMVVNKQHVQADTLAILEHLIIIVMSARCNCKIIGITIRTSTLYILQQQ